MHRIAPFYANLTGRENLDIIRRILKLPKSSVEDALELVGLTEFGNRLAKKYSLGMKQRLGLAGALLGRPPILILDEPTNGLDPSGIHEIRNLVKSLPCLYDCTLLISSPMLSEIELMADDIGILNHGRLLFEGSLDELRQSARSNPASPPTIWKICFSLWLKRIMRPESRGLSYEHACNRASEEKRTGIIPVLLCGWHFWGGIRLLSIFLVRKIRLLNLPLAPMDVLLTQLYGMMIMILNMFGIVVAACMIYNMEFKGNAVKKINICCQ
jgi:hypothetical protein